MTSVIVLIWDSSEQGELQIVVFSGEKQNEVILLCQLIEIVQYAMWANKRIDSADTCNESIVRILFAYHFADARNDNRFNVKDAVNGWDNILLLQFLLFFEYGFKYSLFIE